MNLQDVCLLKGGIVSFMEKYLSIFFLITAKLICLIMLNAMQFKLVLTRKTSVIINSHQRIVVLS